jgi:2-hydroxy-3-oxopropionate reductase
MSAGSKRAIAFLGLGNMGAPMCLRILGAGYALTVWNRSPGKARILSARGARPVRLAADAGAGSDIVILMLADGDAVSEVLFERELAESLRPDTIVLDMSSISPVLACEHAARLARLHVHYLDAPVSGGTGGAAEGTLAIMVGGSPVVFARARALLEVLGRPTLVGPVGCGQLAKLANQVIVASSIAAVAEALVLAAAGGADPAKVREALMGGFADSRILKVHGERMLNRAWRPGGRTNAQVKDLRTILDVASRLHLTLPLSSKVAELFEATVQAGFGDYDHSALLLEIERRNAGVRIGDRQDQVPGERN